LLLDRGRKLRKPKHPDFPHASASNGIGPSNALPGEGENVAPRDGKELRGCISGNEGFRGHDDSPNFRKHDLAALTATLLTFLEIRNYLVGSEGRDGDGCHVAAITHRVDAKILLSLELDGGIGY
jgi:hypothetical protein